MYDLDISDMFTLPILRIRLYATLDANIQQSYKTAQNSFGK